MSDITLSLISALMSLVGVLQSAILLPTTSASSTSVAPVAAIVENIDSQTTHIETIDVVLEDSLPEDDFTVPFYSQFNDITDPSWKKLGCGIASLAMLIELYEPGAVSVDTLLREGIDSGAYLNNAGWTHQGLVNLGKQYGLTGAPHDFSGQTMDAAFAKLSSALDEGPVIASVYYTFDPLSPIPHLVVVNGIEDDTVHYNDPSEPSGGGTISLSSFKQAWKKRYIEIRPVS